MQNSIFLITVELKTLIVTLMEVEYTLYSSKLLVTDFEEGAELIFTKISLRKRMWLFGCSYNPHKSKTENYLNKIKVSLDSFASKNENFSDRGF